MIHRTNYLTTGEFAKIFDIKKDTLFFYDKIKLFCPNFTDDNGYRYYHISQLIEYRTIDLLKDSGLPLSQIKEYLDHKSPQNFLEISNKQIQQLIERKKAIESYINQLDQTNKQITYGMHTDYAIPRITTLPSEKYIVFPLNSTPDEVQEWKIHVAEVLVYCKKHNLLTDFLRGSILKKEKIIQGDYTKDTSIIRVSQAINAENMLERPAGLYGVIEYKGNYHNIHTGYETLIAFIKQNHLEIIGNAYELELVGYLLTENKDEFVVQISIPVQQKKASEKR